jgi:hypothetical protein
MVRDSTVGDAFVTGLAGHPALRALYLNNTQVTNDCIPSLLSLPALRWVDLRGTKVTDAATAPLKERGIVLLDERGIPSQ